MVCKYEEKVRNYGKNIRCYRKLKGLTQQQLADIVGIKRSTLAKIESGDSRGTFETLLGLSDIFKISTDSFFETDKIQMRLDIDLETKKQFEDFCCKAGLSPDIAVTMFIKTTLAQGKIPFEISIR